MWKEGGVGRWGVCTYAFMLNTNEQQNYNDSIDARLVDSRMNAGGGGRREEEGGRRKEGGEGQSGGAQ